MRFQPLLHRSVCAAAAPAPAHENLVVSKLDAMAFISRGLENPSGMVLGWGPISPTPGQRAPASPSGCCCCQQHPGIPRQGAGPPALPQAHPRGCAGSGECFPRPAAWARGNCRSQDWKIPGLKSPCVSQAGFPRRWTVELGVKQAVKVSTTSPRGRCSPELSGGVFPMTVMPALLWFSFLLTFPCTESFLKESQEDGNVPAVTLARIAPGWISQAAKGCLRQPSLLPGLLSLHHLVLCSPLSCRTRFLGAEVMATGPFSLKYYIPVITLLTPPRHSSNCLPWGRRGFSSPSTHKCRFWGMQDPRGAA